MNTLCVVIFALVGLSQACESPPAGPEIDWSKILGKRWYEVANNKSPMDQLYGCGEIVFVKEIPGGVIDSLSIRNANGMLEHSTGRSVRNSDGHYMVELEEGTSEDILKGMERTNMAVPRGEEEIMTKLAHYTDYENYFLSLSCSANGRMDIWYYGKDRNPSAEDILRVTNKLGEIDHSWSQLQLSLDRCVTK